MLENGEARMILAGDIGGTNTRLALFEEGRALKKIAEGYFLNNNYLALLPIIQTFLKQHPKASISCAAFGIAGPVRQGRCQATNIPWVVDSSELEKALKISPIYLLNDLEAYAWGLKVLSPKDLVVLHAGEPKLAGNAALLAAGTGLGEAGLYWDGREHRPFACEGGHTDFGPRDDLEIDLLRYLRKIYGHVSYERIISGPGLYHLYQFLLATGLEKSSTEVQREMALKDPPAVISEWGLKNRDKACARAVDWFISLYGAEAGNLALKIMALGGVYIGGKIATIFYDKIIEGGFVKSFTDKGRFSPLLRTITVHMVLNQDAPWLGAAEYARTH
ncbi:MAG: Glucokinase [Parachlamydiales bacterium]|nr:Glucokinase [Parachlamydiales bacterium]